MTLANPTVDQIGTYTLVVTDTDNGCTSGEVTVEVTTNANIPTFTLDPVGNLDCNNNTQIITGPLGPNYSYQWFFDNNPITGANDPIFEATDPGVYTLVVTDDSNGCSSSQSLEVMSNNDLPTAEAGENVLLTCQAGSVSLNGNGSSTGTSISYSWLDPNGNEVSTTLTVDATQAGNYTLIVTNNDNGCQATDFVTVNADADVPVADAGANAMLDCIFTPIQIGGNSSTGSSITYNWTTISGGTVSNPTIPNPEINQAGTYELLVTDTNNGCTAIDQITISENTNFPSDAIIDISPITCFGDNDATINIAGVTGGTEPFNYALNGSPLSNINNFSNLGQGSYFIQVIDADGCEWNTTILISEPPEFVLDLGEDQIIQLNETYEINAQAFSPINIIEWREDATLSCLDCIAPVASPANTTTYQATAFNANGCESTDQITIFVEKNRDVYFPNVFTPNNDGSNDIFFPQSDDIVENIKTFQVYSRWGEVVYEVTDVMPNDISIGWDGTFKGQKLNPAVFVYYAEVEFIDGVTIIFKGDVAIRK